MIRRIRLFYRRQERGYFCGPAVAQMILASAGVRVSQRTLAQQAGTTRLDGTRPQRLATLLKQYGWATRISEPATLRDVQRAIRSDAFAIVNFAEPSEGESHFAIVTSISRASIVLCDPWNGPRVQLQRREFLSRWYGKHLVHSEHPARPTRRWLLVVKKNRAA